MLNEDEKIFKVTVLDNHVVLDVHKKDLHFWSPQLSFRVEPDEEEPKNCILQGLIGPTPKVWTMFMFFYFAIGMIGFFIFSYGVSRYMMDEYSHTLWSLPITIVFMLSAYLSSKLGERLGHDQTEKMKDFIRDIINKS